MRLSRRDLLTGFAGAAGQLTCGGRSDLERSCRETICRPPPGSWNGSKPKLLGSMSTPNECVIMSADADHICLVFRDPTPPNQSALPPRDVYLLSRHGRDPSLFGAFGPSIVHDGHVYSIGVERSPITRIAINDPKAREQITSAIAEPIGQGEIIRPVDATVERPLSIDGERIVFGTRVLCGQDSLGEDVHGTEVTATGLCSNSHKDSLSRWTDDCHNQGKELGGACTRPIAWLDARDGWVFWLRYGGTCGELMEYATNVHAFNVQTQTLVAFHPVDVVHPGSDPFLSYYTVIAGDGDGVVMSFCGCLIRWNPANGLFEVTNPGFSADGITHVALTQRYVVWATNTGDGPDQILLEDRVTGAHEVVVPRDIGQVPTTGGARMHADEYGLVWLNRSGDKLNVYALPFDGGGAC